MLQKHYKTITLSKIKSKTISKNKFTKLIKRPKKTMTKLMTKMNQSIQFHNEVSSVGCSNSPFRGHLTWHAFAGYLFVISNGSKSIKTNVLLDIGSDATFVTCDISQMRCLWHAIYHRNSTYKGKHNKHLFAMFYQTRYLYL